MAEGTSLGTAYITLMLDKAGFQSQVTGLGRTLTGSLGGIVGMTAKLAGVGAGLYAVKRAIGYVNDAFLEFDQQMHNVWTLTDQTGDEIVKLSSDLRDLAWQYNITSTQAAKAMYQIYSATFYGADAMKILEASTRAAAAGLTDVFTAANMGTTVLNAYGMAAEEITRVNDLLFTSIRFGKTTYGELADQFGRLAGIAAPVGASIDEMAAAIATLTRQGITTDWAVTSLRQTLMKMLQPTKDLEKAINDLGFVSGGTMVRTLGFAKSLGEIKKWADQNGVALDRMFTNVRAVTAVLPLATTAAKGFALDLQRMADSAGASDVAFGKQTQSWAYQMSILKSRLNDVGISLGKVVTPAIYGFTKGVLALLKPLGGMAELLNTMGVPFLLKWAATLGTVVIGLTVLTKAFRALNVAMLASQAFMFSTLGVGGGLSGAIMKGMFTAGGGSMLAGLGIGAAGLVATSIGLKGLVELELVAGQIVGGEEVKGRMKASLMSIFGNVVGGAIFGKMFLGGLVGTGVGAAIGAGIAATATASIFVYHIIKKEVEGRASDIDIVKATMASWGGLPLEMPATPEAITELRDELSRLNPEIEKTKEFFAATATAVEQMYDRVRGAFQRGTYELQGPYRGAATLAGITGIEFPVEDIKEAAAIWKRPLVEATLGGLADLTNVVGANLSEGLRKTIDGIREKASEELDKGEWKDFGDYVVRTMTDWAKGIDTGLATSQIIEFTAALTSSIQAFSAAGDDLEKGKAAAQQFDAVKEAFAGLVEEMEDGERVAAFFQMVPKIAQEYLGELLEVMGIKSAAIVDLVLTELNRLEDELTPPMTVVEQLEKAKKEFYDLFEKIKSGTLTLENATTEFANLKNMAGDFEAAAETAEDTGMSYAASVRALSDEFNDAIGGIDNVISALEKFVNALNNVALAAGAGSQIETLFKGLESMLLRSTTMGEASKIISEIMSGAGTVEAFQTNLERLFGPGSEVAQEVKDWARTMHSLVVDSFPEFGMSMEEVARENERLAAAQAQAADKAQREAEQMAQERYKAEQEAFKNQFLTPIVRAMRSGDFESAAREIEGLTARFHELAAVAAPLGIDAVELLGMMTGARSQLLSMIDGLIEINQALPETVAALEGARKRVEQIQEGPSSAIKAAVEAFGVKDLLETPRVVAQALLEYAKEDVVAAAEATAALTEKITVQTDAMSRFGLTNLKAVDALAIFEEELIGAPTALQKFTNALDKHADTINELANELLPEGMAQIVGKLMTFLQRLGNVKGGWPKYATGGITMKETFATIGESGPEAIIPLSQLPTIMQSLGGDAPVAGPFPSNITIAQSFASNGDALDAVVAEAYGLSAAIGVVAQQLIAAIRSARAKLDAIANLPIPGGTAGIWQPPGDIQEYMRTSIGLPAAPPLGPIQPVAMEPAPALPMTAVPTLDTYEPIDTAAIASAINLAIKDAFAAVGFVLPKALAKEDKIGPTDKAVTTWQEALMLMSEGLKLLFSGDIMGGLELLGKGVMAFADSGAMAALSGGVMVVAEVARQMKAMADEGMAMLNDALKKMGDFVLPILGDSFDAIIASARNLADRFKSLITSTKTYQELQSSYSGLISNIFNSLLGWLLPIIGVFNQLNDTVEETIDKFSSLNVPTGYKVTRAEWRAATPGEPGDLIGGAGAGGGMPQWVTDLLEEFGDAIKDAIAPFKAFFDLMSDVWKELGPVIMKGLLPSLKKFGENLFSIGEKIRDELLPLLKIHLAGTISGLLDFAFGILTAGITFVVDTLIATMPNIELFALSLGRLGDALPGLASALSDALSPAINTFLVAMTAVTDWITTTMIPDLSALFIGFGEFWTKEIGPFLESDVFTKISEVGQWIYDKLGDAIDFAATKLWDFASGPFWDAVVDVVDQVTESFDKLIPILEDNWPAIMQFILDQVEQFGIDIVGMMEKATVLALVKVGESGDALKLLWESETIGLWDKIKISMGIGLASIWEGITKFFEPLLEPLGNLFGALWRALEPVVTIIGVVLAPVLAVLSNTINAIALAFDILAFAIDLVTFPFRSLGVAIHNLVEFVKHPFAPGKRDIWEYPTLSGGGGNKEPAAPPVTPPVTSPVTAPPVTPPASTVPAPITLPASSSWSSARYWGATVNGETIEQQLSKLGISGGLSGLIAGGWQAAGMTEMTFAQVLAHVGSRAGLKAALSAGEVSGVGGLATWSGFSVPGLRYGGKLLTDGLVFGHRGEDVLPAAKVVPLASSYGLQNSIEIINHMTLEVDGSTLAKVITREKRHREKLMTGSPNGRRWERVTA